MPEASPASCSSPAPPSGSLEGRTPDRSGWRSCCGEGSPRSARRPRAHTGPPRPCASPLQRRPSK
eukprot:6307124-Alexandrium_andersonii.AAC.1